MSGLREIIEWVKSEWIFNPENTSNEEFERISKRFKKNNRSALADILRDDSGEFLEFLESELSRAPPLPETDEEIERPEQRASSLERSLEGMERTISKGVEDVIAEPTSIIGKITNFIRGMFR